jgi:hypothetical protein
MTKVKWWMYLAVLFGGSLLSNGCGLGIDNARILWYALREDLFS